MTAVAPLEATSLRARTGGWLATFAVAVIVGHHIGVLLKPLGHLGPGVEWADWVDLLTPYAVVGSALAVLAGAGASRRAWLLAGIGAVVYVQGHGLHLAANSIGNARGNAQPVHLWDEVVGHYLWYAGLYLLVAALALPLIGRVWSSPWRWPLAVLFGVTGANNGIEGGTPYFTLAVALAFCAWGLRRRDQLLVTAWSVTAVLLLGWGVYWAVAEGRSFPQFSELGWI